MIIMGCIGTVRELPDCLDAYIGTSLLTKVHLLGALLAHFAGLVGETEEAGFTLALGVVQIAADFSHLLICGGRVWKTH